MTRKPRPVPPPAAKPKARALTPTAKALEAAVKPVEAMGQTLERALDPLASALKRAALNRAFAKGKVETDRAWRAAPSTD